MKVYLIINDTRSKFANYKKHITFSSSGKEIAASAAKQRQKKQT
jgi:hypothetical protein